MEKAIIDAKLKYGNIFSTVIGDDAYIWRLITPSEYEIIVKTSGHDLDLKEELICQYAVVFPPTDFSKCKAGVPIQLSKQILRESGFSASNKIKEHLAICRENVATRFQEQSVILIASAFPQYKLEEIEGWDMEKLIHMVARAEWKMTNIDGKEFIFDDDSSDEANNTDVDEKEQLKEIEQNIIERGGDPILTLYNDYYKEKKEYFSYPLIMGNNLDREDVLDEVRRQINKRLANK